MQDLSNYKIWITDRGGGNAYEMFLTGAQYVKVGDWLARAISMQSTQCSASLLGGSIEPLEFDKDKIEPLRF